MKTTLIVRSVQLLKCLKLCNACKTKSSSSSATLTLHSSLVLLLRATYTIERLWQLSSLWTFSMNCAWSSTWSVTETSSWPSSARFTGIQQLERLRRHSLSATLSTLSQVASPSAMGTMRCTRTRSNSTTFSTCGFWSAFSARSSLATSMCKFQNLDVSID